ncbi:MAG: SLOG family protein [Candidatus Limivicinus sp.]
MPPEKRGAIAYQLEQTVIMLIQAGIRFFGAGGARGFDTLAAQTILKLRRKYPHIKLILVLPCLSQTQGWRDEDIKVYESIKTAADKVTYTSEKYTQGCMHKRNRHLVDHSSICVCYLTEDRGGTAYTVNYAKKQGLKVINLADV